MWSFIVLQSYVNYTLKEEFEHEKWESNIYNNISKKDQYRNIFTLIFPNTGKENYNTFLSYQCRNAVLFIYSEFENYLYKCFRDIIIAFPKCIENNQVTIKTLIEFEFNPNRVIEYKVDKYLKDRLLNKPYRELFIKASKKFGLKFNINEKELETINKFRELRNLYAHRNGIIDQLFLDKVKDPRLNPGDKVEIDLSMVNQYSQAINLTVGKFDECYINKYPQFSYDISIQETE